MRMIGGLVGPVLTYSRRQWLWRGLLAAPIADADAYPDIDVFTHGVHRAFDVLAHPAVPVIA